MQEQRRTLRSQHPRRLVHHPLQQLIEIDLRGDVGDDVEKGQFLGARLLHPLDGLRTAQRRHRLSRDSFEQRPLALGEEAADLVERLCYADDVTLSGAKRHAEDGFGDVAGLVVDRCG